MFESENDPLPVVRILALGVFVAFPAFVLWMLEGFEKPWSSLTELSARDSSESLAGIRSAAVAVSVSCRLACADEFGRTLAIRRGRQSGRRSGMGRFVFPEPRFGSVRGRAGR